MKTTGHTVRQPAGALGTAVGHATGAYAAAFARWYRYPTPRQEQWVCDCFGLLTRLREEAKS